MSKVLIGNFKGPQGEQGIPGIQGEQGDQGIRGSRWTEGTAITGTSTTPTVFSGTGISDALAEDMYLNTDTGNAYRCTTGGVATVAKWVYACNLKGIKGDTGAKGDPGTAGPKGEKGDTGEQGPKGDTPTVADNMTVSFTEEATRENIATGEKMSVLMGKIKKFFTDLTAPAFAQMITTKEDLLATKAAGYVPDAKAVADAYTELNGNLSELTNDIYLKARTDAGGDIDLPVIGSGKKIIYAYNNANLFVIPRFIIARNCWGVKVLNAEWIPVANTEVIIYYAVVESKS